MSRNPRVPPRAASRALHSALGIGLALALALALAPASAGATQAGRARTAPVVQDSAEAWIERLGAPEARERDRAQRWLAAHLGPEDLPALVRALRAGDAEVRRRLTDALAADERRMDLAAALYVDARPAVRGAGQAALEQMLLAWCPTCGERGLSRAEVRRALEALPATILRLEAGNEPPAALIERLGRLGGLGVPLAIDPALRGLGARRYGGAEGSGFELLESVLEVFGLEVEGFGFEADGELGPVSWLHVTRRGLEGLATGRELLLGAFQAGDAEAPAAARLLATCGWPAALAWLEGRWLRGEVDVLDPLLGAAALGRVAPALATLGGQRVALERAAASHALGTADGREGLERAARGLAASGPLGPLGEDLDAPLLADAGTRADPAALWARLVVLEGRRGGSAAARAQLEALAARPDLAPALRMQVARALAAQAPASPGRAAAPEPAGLAELARWAAAADRGVELVVLASRLGWRAPEGFSADAAEEPALALLVADWLHAAGDGEGGAALLAAAAPALDRDPEGRERALRVLREWSVRAGASAAARPLEAQLEGAPLDGALARLVARAGLLSAARQQALFEALRGAPLEPEDLVLLGHLAAGWGGSEARALLLERLAAGAELDRNQSQLLVRALSAAASALARARQDETLAVFQREVRRRALATRGQPLLELLAPSVWPPRAAQARAPLRELERTLEGILR